MNKKILLHLNKATTIQTMLLLVCILILSMSTTAAGDDFITNKTNDIYLLKGEIEEIKVENLTRISIENSSIADIVKADSDDLILIGKDVGQSILFYWDKNGKHSIMLNVMAHDLEALKARLESLFKTADMKKIKMKINEDEGKIIFFGEVPKKDLATFKIIIGPFLSSIVDLTIPEDIKDQVQIDMQITELSTTLSKSLGIEWTTSAGETSTLKPTYTENLPVFDGSVGDLFKIGDFSRTNTITAAVNALLEEGKARILSKPRLVVVSGESADFQVGGEIPIRTTTVTTGGAVENISFKSYGIQLKITPDVDVENKKVDIDLSTTISDIDQANKVGDNVAFTQRTASTILYLNDKQTIVLAGLIKQTDSETVQKVPFLADVPILGLLFRSSNTPKTETEVVISITPTILLAKKAPASVEKKDDLFSSTGDGGSRRTNILRKTMPYYSGIPQNMREYVQDLQQKLSQSITYPQEAQDYGWEGTVKLGMLILSDGTLAYALVEESSGYEAFDNDAVMTAKNLAPYLEFPTETELQELNITIPIVYSMYDY